MEDSYQGLIVSQEHRKEGDAVVALDFGTSRSAALITLVGRSHDVQIPVSLDGSEVSQAGSNKTPTSLLMKGCQGVQFGARAEEMFASDGRDNPDWLLFKWFKMNLHTPFDRDPEVEALGGRGSRPLSVIVRECLKLVKKEVDRAIEEHGVGTSKRFWVLTVPAIWSDFSKDMMRTAAFQADLIPNKHSSRLMLGIEPECAAVASNMWGKGTKFMIVDCGGGTVDITYHNIVHSEPLVLEELRPATGGPLGATLVDKEFLSFFALLLGCSNYENLENNHPEEFLSLLRMWEAVKVGCLFDKNQTAFPRLALTDIFSVLGLKYSNLESMVNSWNGNNPHRQAVMVKRPKVGLIFTSRLLESFFVGVVRDITQLVMDQHVQDLKLDYLILVGGFSKCTLLKEHAQDAFKNQKLRIVTSIDADMAIVKGAARFGANMNHVIKTRKARCTFGVATRTQYNELSPQHYQHKHKVVRIGGKDYLKVFKAHGRLGDDLEAISHDLRRYVPITEMQSKASIKILVSSKKDIFLTDEDEVQRLATTRIPFDMSLPFEDRRVWVGFSFGGPEVRCHVFGPSKDQELGTVAINFDHF